MKNGKWDIEDWFRYHEATPVKKLSRKLTGEHEQLNRSLVLSHHGCLGTARGAAAEEAAQRISATKTIGMVLVQRF